MVWAHPRKTKPWRSRQGLFFGVVLTCVLDWEVEVELPTQVTSRQVV